MITLDKYMTEDNGIKKGRPAEPSSYYSLLKHYNKNSSKAEKIECECGKILFKSQYEGHLTTKMHEQLIKYKKLAEKGENIIDKAVTITPTKEPITTPDESIDELLLKISIDPDYRKKVKNYISLFEK
jgi:hypothetical protein